MTIRTNRAGRTACVWLLLCAALFVLSGAVATLADQGARNVVLAWAAQFVALPNETSHREEIKSRRPESADGGTEAHDGSIESVGGRPLPAPDPRGVIRLDGAGPWKASAVIAVGPLAIVGDADNLPQIVIEDRPLKLWAEEVTLRNVRISLPPANRSARLNALVLIHAQGLSVEGCAFDGGVPRVLETERIPSENTPPAGPALLAWRLLDPRDGRGGSASIRRTLLVGTGPGLYLAHAVRKVVFDNVLKLGTGPLVQLATVPDSKSRVVLGLIHTTCRASGALLRWVIPADGSPAGSVLLEAADCVFDVSPGAALFEFAGHRPRAEWQQSVKMTGEGSICPPTLDIAAWISMEDGQMIPLDSSVIELEGISAGPFQFASKASPRPADSEVRDCDVPRRTNDQPGIRAAEVPGS